jgi:hypothetical protein
MNDLGTTPDLGYEPPTKQRPLGLIAAVVTFLLLMGAGFWIIQDKKQDKAKQEILDTLDKELTQMSEALKDQREKLVELSTQVDTMRAAIQSGVVPNKKAAVAEFNKLAAQQRAEREVYTKMAEEYNKKVAEFKKLEP